MNNISIIGDQWLSKGVAVVPCHYRSKRPKVAWEHYQTHMPTSVQASAWFASSQVNLAVVCGWQGLTVIDFDSFDAYELWLQWYTSKPYNDDPAPIFDRTFRVITGRGVHLYLFVDEPVESSHIPSIVDIKATGIVLTPPSIHPSGRRYVGNDMPIVRVKSLSGIVPDEWLQHSEHATNYLPPTILSNQPLDRIDQCQASLVNTLRNRVRIQDLIKATPTRDGWQVTRCPFHADGEPSFWIDTKRQLCGCYAGCTPKPLDVINLYARLNHLSNSEAIATMARMI